MELIGIGKWKNNESERKKVLMVWMNNPVVSKRKRDFCLYHLKTGSLSCELMKSLESHRSILLIYPLAFGTRTHYSPHDD